MEQENKSEKVEMDDKYHYLLGLQQENSLLIQTIVPGSSMREQTGHDYMCYFCNVVLGRVTSHRSKWTGFIEERPPFIDMLSWLFVQAASFGLLEVYKSTCLTATISAILYVQRKILLFHIYQISLSCA